MLVHSMAETFRSGSRGAAHDLRLITADWGVPLDLVTVEVRMWHGDADPEVSSSNARRLAVALPRCQVHLLAGAGHHVDLAHPERLLAAVGEG